MTITFGSCAAFAGFVTELAHHMDKSEKHILEHAGKTIRDEAKRVIGTYEYGWPPLAASTVERKGADTPLLETGEMRDSIAFNVQHREVRIGSDEEKAVYHELGTSKIPPRPFLSGAAMHKEKELVHAIGEHSFKLLSGESGERP